MAKQTIQIADKPTVDEILEYLKNDTHGLEVLQSLLSNSSYGLSALKTLIDAVAKQTTANTIQSLLQNNTYGLNALKTAISSVSASSSGNSYPNVSIKRVGETYTHVKNEVTRVGTGGSSGNTYGIYQIRSYYTASNTPLSVTGKGKFRILNNGSLGAGFITNSNYIENVNSSVPKITIDGVSFNAHIKYILGDTGSSTYNHERIIVTNLLDKEYSFEKSLKIEYTSYPSMTNPNNPAYKIVNGTTAPAASTIAPTYKGCYYDVLLQTA